MSDVATLQLAAALDASAAVELHAALNARRGAALALDASTVSKLGAQCFQVLLAALAAWRADGNALSITDPSSAFVEAIRLMEGAGLVEEIAA